MSTAGDGVGTAACPWLAAGSSSSSFSSAGERDLEPPLRVVNQIYVAIDAGDDHGVLSLVTPHALFEVGGRRAEGRRAIHQMLVEERLSRARPTMRALADIDARFARTDVAEVIATVVTHIRGTDSGWAVADVQPARHVLRQLGDQWVLTACVFLGGSPETSRGTCPKPASPC